MSRAKNKEIETSKGGPEIEKESGIRQPLVFQQLQDQDNHKEIAIELVWRLKKEHVCLVPKKYCDDTKEIIRYREIISIQKNSRVGEIINDIKSQSRLAAVADFYELCILAMIEDRFMIESVSSKVRVIDVVSPFEKWTCTYIGLILVSKQDE
jgi:hypothetical protein